MKIFFTDGAHTELKKLEKKPSYKDLRLHFFEYIIKNPTIDCWKSGARLNPGSSPFPMIKRYFAGSGKYRICYLLVIKEDEITLSALYPKAGSKGTTNLTNEGKKKALLDALNARLAKNRWELVMKEADKTISFKEES